MRRAFCLAAVLVIASPVGIAAQQPSPAEVLAIMSDLVSKLEASDRRLNEALKYVNEFTLLMTDLRPVCNGLADDMAAARRRRTEIWPSMEALEALCETASKSHERLESPDR